MVMQPKNHDPMKLRVCVDYRWLNRAIFIDPFPTPFSDEIINEVVGHEFYSFTDGFLGYNQVPYPNKNNTIPLLCVSLAHLHIEKSLLS
jgi:hypothetical protein